MTIEQISLTYEKLEIVNICRNLISRYSFLIGENRMREVADMFARRGDTTVAMPWGCYDGFEGAVRCFTTDHLDIDDDGAFEKLKGIWNMDSLTSVCVEVADDLETARASCVSHRIETNPTENEIPVYSKNSYFCWGRYGFDFIREDGEWKIWHMYLVPVLKMPYLEDWKDYAYKGFELRVPTIDRPAMKTYQWNPNDIAPLADPEPPLPYKTFADVAPGYGYAV